MVAWYAPERGGALPPYAVNNAGNPIHSPSASNIVMSSVAPSPVRPRRTSAARIDEKAYMPAAISATGMPAFDGESGVPVTDSRPVSHWTSRSYAFFSAYGPAGP